MPNKARAHARKRQAASNSVCNLCCGKSPLVRPRFRSGFDSKPQGKPESEIEASKPELKQRPPSPNSGQAAQGLHAGTRVERVHWSGLCPAPTEAAKGEEESEVCFACRQSCCHSGAETWTKKPSWGNPSEAGGLIESSNRRHG